MKFTPQQLNNLKLFLLRTDLKGYEVEAFMELVNILNNSENPERFKEQNYGENKP